MTWLNRHSIHLIKRRHKQMLNLKENTPPTTNYPRSVVIQNIKTEHQKNQNAIKLNIEEGSIYIFGNDYTRMILKSVDAMVYGNPIVYDEDKNSHYYEDSQWLTINCPYSDGSGEYPFPHFEGVSKYDEQFVICVDDITHFIILPTQKPKQAKILEQCASGHSFKEFLKNRSK